MGRRSGLSRFWRGPASLHTDAHASSSRQRRVGDRAHGEASAPAPDPVPSIRLGYQLRWDVRDGGHCRPVRSIGLVCPDHEADHCRATCRGVHTAVACRAETYRRARRCRRRTCTLGVAGCLRLVVDEGSRLRGASRFRHSDPSLQLAACRKPPELPGLARLRAGDGTGWWTNPQIAYLARPAAGVDRHRRPPSVALCPAGGAGVDPRRPSLDRLECPARLGVPAFAVRR